MIRSKAVGKQCCSLYLCSRLYLANGSEIPHPCIIENSISCILANFQFCFPALSSILMISVSPSAFFKKESLDQGSEIDLALNGQLGLVK